MLYIFGLGAIDERGEEERCRNEVPVNFFTSLLYKASRFHVAWGLLSNRSQKRAKCDKDINNTVTKWLVSQVFVLITF